jgi:hypothetical protein
MIVNCTKRELVWRFAILLKGLRLLPTSVSEVVGSLTAAASHRIAFVLRVCVLVVVTLVCWPVGNSYAWAKSDPPKPTLHFHVDRLEVEAKEANKRPIEVTVSNVDDPGDSLDFSAEVQDVQRILNARDEKSPESNPDRAQMTLRFLDDPLDLTLRDPKNVAEASRQKCNRQDGTYKPVRSGRQFKPSKIIGSTVFVGYNGAKDDLKKIRFRADVTEKPVGHEPERPEDERIKVFTVCPHLPNKDGTYDSPYNTPAPGVASFDVLFEVKSPAEKPWLENWTAAEWWNVKVLLEFVWKYVGTADIPYSWANLSGQLVADVEDPATEKIVEETESATLSLQLFSPTPNYLDWISRIAVVALIFTLTMAFILAEGVARYNTEGSAHWLGFAKQYAITIAFVVVLYISWEKSNAHIGFFLPLLVVILALLAVLPVLPKVEGNTTRQ